MTHCTKRLRRAMRNYCLTASKTNPMPTRVTKMHTMSKRATRSRIRQRDTAIDACHPAILAETGDRDPPRMAVFGDSRHTAAFVAFAAAVAVFLRSNYKKPQHEPPFSASRVADLCVGHVVFGIGHRRSSGRTGRPQERRLRRRVEGIAPAGGARRHG